jgi:4-amino-4-deoxy-L-arabinose transferase-like glycosyltransferase
MQAAPLLNCRDQMLSGGKDMAARGPAQRALSIVAVSAFILVAVLRVILVDKSIPQGFDEPSHVAAGIELLDRHTYRLDPIHPPLSRVAIALPLYLLGERLPAFPANDPRAYSHIDLGNAILSDGGHYVRNLLLARSTMLPFLCLCALLVFWWTSRQFGMAAGCVAVFLFSTLPSVLAFSSIAYTDVPTACTQFACLFAFSVWLEKPTMWSTVLLGVSAGVALSTKLTSFLFLPFAGTAMFLTRYWLSSDGIRELKVRGVRLATAAVVGLVILWSAYAFSVGHLQDAMGVSAASIPGFRRFPGPIRSVARELVRANPLIPGPDFVRGVAEIRRKNNEAPESYLLGKSKPGGWWYFFPVAVALKTPLPFMVLGIAGVVYAIRVARKSQGSSLMPAAASTAIFVATIFVTLKVGTRHVLTVLPLLSVLAGAGAAFLWQIPRAKPIWGRLALCLLLAWQAAVSVRAQSDFLAYFNELAPHDPSIALVKGCDLDCGQDLSKLRDELRARHVMHFSIGVFSSADLAEFELPPFDALKAEPVTGWVAVSVRSLRTGVFAFSQNGHVVPYIYRQNALSWLEGYRPVAHVGDTILLYDIPETSIPTATQN